MKLSVLAVALADRPLADALQFLKERGVQQVEVGCGGYPGKAHCDPAVLLNDPKKLQAFKDTFARSGLTISALSASRFSAGMCLPLAMPPQPMMPIFSLLML